MWAALLKAMLAAMAQNSAKASKGEEANATISPMALIPGSPGTAETSTMGTVNTAPADYYKSAEAIGMKNYIKDAGGELLNSLNPVGTAYAGESNNMPNANLGKIFVNPNKQFNRIESNNPEELPTGVIPEQYRGMGQGGGNPQNTQRPDVGFMRGLINATTGQPQPEGLGDVSQGRKTAYYSGELIPKIIMSKLGQPSPTEASEAQSRISQRERWSDGQPVIDPQTGTVMYVRPKGSVFNPESPEAKSQREITTATTKESNIRLNKLKELNKSVDFFENKINEIPVGTGLEGRIQGLGNIVGGKLQTDPKSAAYMSSVSGMRSQIARGLGDVGNLSETEQKYAIELLPTLGDNMETRLQKIQNFRDYVKFKTGQMPSQVEPVRSKFNFSGMTTDELMLRKQQLLQGGGQ